jgi:hypothetical protein
VPEAFAVLENPLPSSISNACASGNGMSFGIFEFDKTIGIGGTTLIMGAGGF